MKKNLLIIACLFLTLANQAQSTEISNSPTNAEVKQKACQNVFSLINIDLSVMSPRATVADVSVPTPMAPDARKGAIVPISNRPPEPRPEMTPPPAPQRNKTSLFRLDLLHIFKIQVL